MSPLWQQWADYDDRTETPVMYVTDLDLYEHAPDDDLPSLGRLKCELRHADRDGFCSPKEEKSFAAISSYFGSITPADSGAVFCGIRTSAGTREYLFYVRNQEFLDRIAAEATRLTPGYQFQVVLETDPGWKYYRNTLFPGLVLMQWQEDERVVEYMRSEGNNEAVPRPVRHWVNFPVELKNGIKLYIDTIRQLNFELESDETSEAEDGRSVRVLTILKDQPTDIISIKRSTAPLFLYATQLGGEYGGWEAQMIG